MNPQVCVVHEEHDAGVFYHGPFLPRTSPEQRFAALSIKNGLYMAPPAELLLRYAGGHYDQPLIASETLLAALLRGEDDVTNLPCGPEPKEKQ